MTSNLKETEILTNSESDLVTSEYPYCPLPDGYFDFLNHLRSSGKDKVGCVSIQPEALQVENQAYFNFAR